MTKAFTFMLDVKQRCAFRVCKYQWLNTPSCREAAAALGKLVAAEDGVAPAVDVILKQLATSKPLK